MRPTVKIVRDSKDYPSRVEVTKGSKKWVATYDRDRELVFDRDVPSDILDYFQLIFPFSEKPEPKNENSRVFRFSFLHEDQLVGWLNGSETLADVPWRLLDQIVQPHGIQEGIINRIHYRINPTNVATYTLRIMRAAEYGPYNNQRNVLYSSAAAQADDTDYQQTGLNIPFRLNEPGKMYYQLEWSAAAGATSGFIEVSGQSLR